jgi:hypothetical protein
MTLQLVTSEILPDFRFLSKSRIPIGFEAILNEVDDLQGVSARLEVLAEQYPPVTEALMTISGNVLNTATVLAVVAAIKSPKPNWVQRSRLHEKEIVSLPESRHLAQRLLAYEAVAGENSEAAESAAFRVCTKLRRPLLTLAGVDGFRSLLSRALTLARAEAPSLSAVQVAADGSLKGLDELADDTEQDRDGGAILIAQLIGLLLTFIGEGLTLRLVQDVWPEAAFDGRVSEKEGKAWAHQIRWK